MNAWLLALAVAVGVYLALVGLLLLIGRRSAAKEIALLLPNLITLFHGLTRDPRVPRRAKVLLVLGGLWLVSPIDLIPEFVPVAGPLDDAVVAALILRYIVRVAGEETVRENWRGNAATLNVVLRLTGKRGSDATGAARR